MHLSGLGGYIDAQPEAVTACREAKETWSPFSCGHYINHPPRGGYANVSVIAFKWIDVFHSCQKYHHQSSSSTSLLKFFNSIVPNQFAKGAWFIDHQKTQGEDTNNGIVHIEDLYQNDNVTSLMNLGGVAFVANGDIMREDSDSADKDSLELFLDYKLEPKYQPEWYVVPF